ncbi:MAG: carboxylesterase family protein [Terriglobales bacterium]
MPNAWKTLTSVPFGADLNAAAFLGIPYAAPPVGGLRWKPSVPVQSWRGMHDATQFQKSPP